MESMDILTDGPTERCKGASRYRDEGPTGRKTSGNANEKGTKTRRTYGHTEQLTEGATQ